MVPAILGNTMNINELVSRYYLNEVPEVRTLSATIHLLAITKSSQTKNYILLAILIRYQYNSSNQNGT